MMKNVFSILALCLGSLLIAQDYEAFGLKEEKLPRGLELGMGVPNFMEQTLTGKRLELDEMLKKGPVLLVFFRGAWCPYCTRHIAQLYEAKSLLAERQVEMVFVTPHAPLNLQELQDQYPEINLVSDNDYSSLEDYKVLFEVNNSYKKKFEKYFNTTLDAVNVQNKTLLPIPATFLIAQDGTLIYKHFDYDYKQRSEPELILKALESYGN